WDGPHPAIVLKKAGAVGAAPASRATATALPWLPGSAVSIVASAELARMDSPRLSISTRLDLSTLVSAVYFAVLSVVMTSPAGCLGLGPAFRRARRASEGKPGGCRRPLSD